MTTSNGVDASTRALGSVARVTPQLGGGAAADDRVGVIAHGLLEQRRRGAADVVSQKPREVVVVARRRVEAAEDCLDQLGIRAVGGIAADRIAKVLEALGPV